LLAASVDHSSELAPPPLRAPLCRKAAKLEPGQLFLEVGDLAQRAPSLLLRLRVLLLQAQLNRATGSAVAGGGWRRLRGRAMRIEVMLRRRSQCRHRNRDRSMFPRRRRRVGHLAHAVKQVTAAGSGRKSLRSQI
jgi:hypothetical protein